MLSYGDFIMLKIKLSMVMEFRIFSLHSKKKVSSQDIIGDFYQRLRRKKGSQNDPFVLTLLATWARLKFL